jgi:hypothetical protein
MSNELCQQGLADSIFSHRPRPIDVTRAVFLVLHGVAASRQQDELLKDHLTTLARILDVSRATLAPPDFNTLKEMVFLSPSILNDIMMAPVSSLVLKGEFKLSLTVRFPS